MKAKLFLPLLFLLFQFNTKGQHLLLEDQDALYLTSLTMYGNIELYPETDELIYRASWIYNNIPSGLRYGLVSYTDSLSLNWWGQNYADNRGYPGIEEFKSQDGNFMFLRNTIYLFSSDIYFSLRKLDEEKNEIWVYGGESLSTSMDETPDGQYLIAGSHVNPATSMDSTFVQKIDNDGNFIWEKEIDFYPNRILSTSNNKILIAGQEENDSEIYIALYDAELNLEWVNQYGNAGGYSFSEFIETSEENFVLVGEASSFSPDQPFLLHIDSLGNEIGNTLDQDLSALGITGKFNTVIQLQDGNFLAGGQNHHFDGSIVKINSNGEVEWSDTKGGTNKDVILDLKLYNGELHFAGATESFNGDLTNIIPPSNWEKIWTGKILLSEFPPIFFEVFFDENQNQILDTNEVLIPDQQVDLSPIGNTYFSSSVPTGLFLLEGNNELQFTPANNWMLTTDSSSFQFLVDSNSIVDTFQFGITPTTQISMMNSSITGNFTRCGFNVPFNIHTENMGTTKTSGTIWIHMDTIATVTFTATSSPDTIIGDSIAGWSFSDLYPGYSIDKKIYFEIPIPPNITIGDNLHFQSYIEFTDINGTQTSPVFNYDPEVLCAYDPNDKLVYPDRNNILTLFEENLTYTVRFQNTGNAEAIDVVIRDTLDENLDPASFRILSVSHPDKFETTLKDGKFLTFSFKNIYLPDSTTNFEGSQGFVSYFISPKENILSESLIQNTASIYFDFNPPIVTNTTKNIIVYDNDMDGFWSNEDCEDDDININPAAEEIPNNGIDEDCDGADLIVISNKELNSEQIQFFPNPVSDFLFIKKETSQTYLFEIVDVTGKVITNGKINSRAHSIPFTKMNAGIYFVKIIDPKTEQFIVEKIVK